MESPAMPRRDYLFVTSIKQVVSLCTVGATLRLFCSFVLRIKIYHINASLLLLQIRIYQPRNQGRRLYLPAAHAAHINSHNLFSKSTQVFSTPFFFWQVHHHSHLNEFFFLIHPAQSYH